MSWRSSKSAQNRPVVVPDTGKKGVQPIGQVNPRPRAQRRHRRRRVNDTRSVAVMTGGNALTKRVLRGGPRSIYGAALVRLERRG